MALCLAGERLLNSASEEKDETLLQIGSLALLTAPLPDDAGADRETPQPWKHGVLLPVCSDTGLGTTSTVGCFPRGASPFGCEEMAGNVWEWCLNPNYDYKKGELSEKMLQASLNEENMEILRGGAWDIHPRNCRCACRIRFDPDSRFVDRGFRVVAVAAWTL